VVGYFGTYVSDFVDGAIDVLRQGSAIRSTVMGNAKMDETDFTGSYIDPNTAIHRGKISGAQYVVQVTMQKPDVVNVRTGIPLASIMGAFQAGFGKNLGAQYNVECGGGDLDSFGKYYRPGCRFADRRGFVYE